MKKNIVKSARYAKKQLMLTFINKVNVLTAVGGIVF